ncbi:MAG: hypothetical protein GC168_01035 [Candidatus Hydrogenedens sp.]|nr:hypothetical protein [Candidatus Hydrogenedens sp.]
MAIRLMAAQGIHVVSLRTVNAEAGCLKPLDIFERFFEFLEGAMRAPWSDGDPAMADRIGALLEP